MKISYHWLKQYVACDLAPEDLAERLTMAGLEVDAVEPVGYALDGVVVGRVEAVRPHPDADRLVLCDVRLEDGLPPVQIVCGAPNVAAGQHVPVAPVGTTLQLPDRDDPTHREPVTVRAATLRGASSEGMICAEDELGLSADHSGIMVLDDDAPLGQPFADYLSARGIEVPDVVLDIELTPNRPDAASHLGVARDVAALLDQQLCPPEADVPASGGAAAEALTIRIEAPEACPRYVGMLVRGVTVRESPIWLKRRLTAIGLRPRNHVVDVTNYVLHACGQPLHAFDFGRIAGHTIVVRKAEAETPFVTLDDAERTLPAGALLICDAERPVALAGVMGGANSEVTDATTDVLIESAYFAPASIRRTASHLGVSTDASYRFERGANRTGQARAAAWAARLIAELGDGAVVPGMVDAHPLPYEPRTVDLRPARANQLLGLDLDVETMTNLLEAVGVVVTERDPLAAQAIEGRGPELDAAPVVLRCVVPSYRPDIEREVDLIEEVARLHGYDRIPTPDRVTAPAVVPREAAGYALRRTVRARLTGLGFREVYTNSLLRREAAECFVTAADDDASGSVIETLKPFSLEMAALRPSLLPGVLEVMAHNVNHGQHALRLFELGHVFARTAGTDEGPVSGFAEHEALLVAQTGPATPPGWDAPARPADVFDLKGVVQALAEVLRLPDVRIEPAQHADPRFAYHATVYSGDLGLGLLGRVADDRAAAYDLAPPVLAAELDWDALVRVARTDVPRYRPVSRHPTVERDLAVLVERDQPVGPLLDAIRAAARPLLRHVSVFDLYEGEGVPEGRKSVAFGLRFGTDDRTLTDDEVDARIDAVTAALSERYGARLRG